MSVCLHVCLCTTYRLGVLKDQKRVLDLLELELQTVLLLPAELSPVSCLVCLRSSLIDRAALQPSVHQRMTLDFDLPASTSLVHYNYVPLVPFLCGAGD